MFEIRAIQAEHGDALFVTYGEPDEIHHLLVDGGPTGTRKNLIKVLEQARNREVLRLEALVVTHYDLDHIQGVIELLSNKPDWLLIDDIWFNGYRHLHGTDRLGAAEGDTLTTLIKNGKYAWNKAFGGHAIHQEMRPVTLLEGMTVYVLSPDKRRLAALADDWIDPRFAPEDTSALTDLLGRKDSWPPENFSALISNDHFDADNSVPNGSSIALLLEYRGRRVLLAADSHPGVVKSGMARYFPEGIELDLLKVSHHGSKANTDKSLLDALRCRRFLFSTNGKRHKHPDNLLIARLLAANDSPYLYFNYDVEQTTRWGEELPMGWPYFNALYPSAENVFICVDVMSDPR